MTALVTALTADTRHIDRYVYPIRSHSNESLSSRGLACSSIRTDLTRVVIREERSLASASLSLIWRVYPIRTLARGSVQAELSDSTEYPDGRAHSRTRVYPSRDLVREGISLIRELPCELFTVYPAPHMLSCVYGVGPAEISAYPIERPSEKRALGREGGRLIGRALLQALHYLPGFSHPAVYDVPHAVMCA